MQGYGPYVSMAIHTYVLLSSLKHSVQCKSKMFPTKSDLNIQNLEDSNCSPFKIEASILVKKFAITSSETLTVVQFSYLTGTKITSHKDMRWCCTLSIFTGLVIR